jgi:hypothetical protein
MNNTTQREKVMSERTVMFRGESYKVIAYPLSQIIGTDNCRRPCPVLWNLGLDPWNAYRQITSDDIAQVREGVELLEKSPRFREMATSISGNAGQLQAIGLRSYRARSGKVDGVQMYEDRAALSYGNGRLFAVALLEGRRKIALADGQKVNKNPITVDAVLMRLTREESYELSIEENDKRTEMDDLDWGLLFDRDLKTMNPETQRLFTIKEVAIKRGKNYHWVRGRAALPYLPPGMLREITDWNKVNIDALCQTALRYKAGAKQEVVVDQGEAPDTSTPAPKLMTAGMATEDGDAEQPQSGLANRAALNEPEVKPIPLPVEVQPKKRRTVMTLKEMGQLFARTTNDDARNAIAMCMKMTSDEAADYAASLIKE